MSLVLSEPHPDVDKVILSVRELQNIRAEYERLRSINAELLKALEWYVSAFYGDTECPELMDGMLERARAAIERART